MAFCSLDEPMRDSIFRFRRGAVARFFLLWGLIVTAVGLDAGEPVTRSDRSFRNERAEGNAAYALALRPDGRIWVGGDFTRLGGASVTNLALLEADGSLVLGFVSAVETNFVINSVIVEPDGGCLVAGSGPNNVPQPNGGRGEKTFFRVGPDGKIDPGFPGWTNSAGTAAFRVVRLADGRTLLTSVIASGSEFPDGSGGLVNRFSAVGEWDPTFASNLVLAAEFFDFFGTGETNPAPTRVLDVLPLPDGNFLVGGIFSGTTNWLSRGLLKLSPAGEVLRDWSSPLVELFGGTSIYRLRRLEDGSILVGGAMSLENSSNRVLLLRLKPDLSVDENFHVVRFEETPFWDNYRNVHWPSAYDVSSLPDGRIVLGGLFFKADGYWRRGLCVLLADGTVDPGVETGWGVGIDNSYNRLTPITGILPWKSGRVLAAGTHRGFDFDERPLLMDLILGTDGPLSRVTLYSSPSEASPQVWAFFPPSQVGHVQESTNLVDWRTIHTADASPIYLAVTNATDLPDPFPWSSGGIPQVARPGTNVFYRLMTEPE